MRTHGCARAVARRTGSARRAFVAAFAAIVAVPAVGAAAEVPALELGTLPGGTFSFALGANNAGQVVGQSDVGGVSHPFLWTTATGMTDLGLLPGDNQGHAIQINDAGEVIGSSVDNANGTQRGFYWSEGEGMIDLGSLTSTIDTTPIAINASGQVVGVSNFRAFSWTRAAGMVDIGTLPGDISALAVDVNDAGQVAAVSESGSSRRSFVWTAAGDRVDIGSLGGGSTAAVTINNAGQVVGASTTASGATHAFSWTAAGGMVDLGLLPGHTFSRAVRVNDAGTVVANSDQFGGTAPPRGFVWTADGGQVPIGTPSDVSLIAGINNTGQVVGRHGIPFGPFREFVWTAAGGEAELLPVPGSGASVSGISDSGVAFGVSGGFATIWNTGVDETPPVLTPSIDGPVYLNATGIVANPNATDDGSGIASQECDPLDASTVGAHTVTCRAVDNAGNTAEATLGYTVEYKLLLPAPAQGSVWDTRSTVPVRLVLADANGIAIPDRAAAQLARTCQVTFSAGGAQDVNTTCMSYEDHRFIGRVKLGTTTGAETITIAVAYPGTTATSTATVEVTVVRKR